MSHPNPNPPSSETPAVQERRGRFRRLGSSDNPSNPETSSEPTDPPADPETTIAGRLGIFATEIADMAPDHGMGGILKKLLPRLVGDLGAVPDERLAVYLDHLTDRLRWVHDGGPRPEPAPTADPTVEVDCPDDCSEGHTYAVPCQLAPSTEEAAPGDAAL